MWAPLSWNCCRSSLISVPPSISRELVYWMDQPSINNDVKFVESRNSLRMLCVWLASSRVGDRITHPTSCFFNGVSRFMSCCITGSKKANVFPEPVGAWRLGWLQKTKRNLNSNICVLQKQRNRRSLNWSHGLKAHWIKYFQQAFC